jgi:hypothetical protein
MSSDVVDGDRVIAFVTYRQSSRPAAARLTTAAGRTHKRAEARAEPDRHDRNVAKQSCGLTRAAVSLRRNASAS